MNIQHLTALHKGLKAVHNAALQGEKIVKADYAHEIRERASLLSDPEVIQAVQNANTIATELKRDVILQQLVGPFARRVLPLSAFSTVFHDVPLQGTNKVQVPYYDLDTAASTSFDETAGYSAGNTTVDNREIQIGKRATADVADDTKRYDRKFQALGFSSEEIARQPLLNLVETGKLKAEKLGSDIVTHVLSIVTNAEYGAAVLTKVAALFNSDDLAALKLACKLWEEGTRSLIIASEYDAALLQDAAFKNAFAAGTDRAIREGKLAPVVYGFSYYENPTIPDNAENLVGMVAHKAAILFAQAPVMPSPAVLNAGTTYSVAVDPTTGIALEYRTFGNNQLDRGVHIVEASYGFEKGREEALKRIVSA